MSVGRIVSRYAKSLIDLAIERGKLERVKEDFDSFNLALKNRPFFLMLKSPIVGPDKKKKVFQSLFAGKFDELSMAFLNILVVKGRESFLPEISREFNSQYRAYKNISTVRITAPAPLSEDLVETIRKKLLTAGVVSGQLEMEVRVDPSLVGGLTLEFGDMLYDASASRKLESFRNSFKDNLYISKIISR